jgi:phosphate transport system substrate-binding protein
MKHNAALRYSALFLGTLLAANSSFAGFSARGSDSTINVVKALAEAFQTKSGIAIQIEGGGSGAGAKAAMAGEVQLAFLSRALDEKEKAGGLNGSTYAIDAVAVIVNNDNPASNLTLAELKDLFTGTTAAWPDGKPVVPYNRNADSGTREIFQDKVLGKGVAFSASAAIKHDGVLLGAVAKITSSVGYDGFGHVDQKLVKIVAVNGVLPSPATIRSGAYPLTRTPTFATKGDVNAEVKLFVDFAMSPEGQAIVVQNGLVSLK